MITCVSDNLHNCCQVAITKQWITGKPFANKRIEILKKCSENYLNIKVFHEFNKKW